MRTRLVGSYGWYDGYLENRTTGGTVNGYERGGVRGIVEADVGERLQLTFIGDYRRAKDDCCTEIIGQPPGGAAMGSLNGVTCRGSATRWIWQNFLTSTGEKSWGLSLGPDLELGRIGTLTSITAWRDWKNPGMRDGDWLDQPFVGVARLHDFGPQPSDIVTREVRIAGGERLQLWWAASSTRPTPSAPSSATSSPARPPPCRPSPAAPGGPGGTIRHIVGRDSERDFGVALRLNYGAR